MKFVVVVVAADDDAAAVTDVVVVLVVICLVLVGTIFPTNDAAFANYRVWNAAGNAVIFATTGSMCVRTRLYMLLSVLILSMICLIVVHKRYRYRNNSEEYELCNTDMLETIEQSQTRRRIE